MRYKPKTPMRVYQTRALKKFIRNRGVLALHMPMRSGKTKTSIDCAGAARMIWGRPKRVLVVCPMSVIDVWVNELRKHHPGPWEAYTRYGHTIDLKETRPTTKWKIVNYEATYKRMRVETDDGYAFQMVPNDELYEFAPEMIICDEATALGDPTTKQSIFISKLSRDLNVPYRIILTGTPWHRRVLKSFGAFKFLNPDIFGTNWTVFKKTYGMWAGYAGSKLVKYINLDQFVKKVEPWAFTMKHVPPMKPVHQVIPIQLTQGVEQYKEMADEAYTEVKGHQIEAPIVIVRIRKLAQLANGYVFRYKEGKKGNRKRKLLRVGNDKSRFAADHLAQLRSEGVRKLVLVVEELPQLGDAAMAAKKAGYKTILFYGAVGDRERRIASFQTTKDEVCMVMQISTGQMGIDLSSADTMGFWTPPTSLLQWDQVSARIRVYADMRTLYYFYYVMKGTIEEAKYLALQQNQELAKLVGDHPSLISFSTEG